MPENRWYIESKMREMSPKRVTLSTLHGFRDKSSIDSINTGKETVYGDYSLPANFALAYATSDAGAESWINKEMKRRDRVASSAISRILNDQELLAVVRAAGRVYVKNTFEQGA